MRTLLCIICSAWLCGLSYEAASADRLSSDEILTSISADTGEGALGHPAIGQDL